MKGEVIYSITNNELNGYKPNTFTKLLYDYVKENYKNYIRITNEELIKIHKDIGHNHSFNGIQSNISILVKNKILIYKSQIRVGERRVHFDNNIKVGSKEYLRQVRLKCEYNISNKDFENLKLQQNNVCKICNKKYEDKELSVDHCHTTNIVRGLLCSQCNTAIGLFKEDINVMKNAVKYLLNND